MEEKSGSPSQIDEAFFRLMEEVEIPPRPYEHFTLEQLIIHKQHTQDELVDRGELKTPNTTKGTRLKTKLMELLEEIRIKKHELQ